METLWQDLKYAARMLRRSPGFTLAAVFALALGIGANTAMFSVVNAVLLNSRPLAALKDPERLTMIWEKHPALSGFLAQRLPTCLQNYLAWQKQNRSFEDIGLVGKQNFNLTGVGPGAPRPEQVDAARATANFFSVLGASPRLGRSFTAEEMQPGRGHVAILSDELYRSRFHGDPRILERRIRVDSEDYQVVGVLPPGFELPAIWEGFDQVKAQLWVPVTMGTSDGQRKDRNYYAYGRLKPGVNLSQARAEMAVIAKSTERADPDLNGGAGANVFPVSVEDVSPLLRRSLLVLQVAVAFVLLIACANVANLLLTRAVGREREIAIRVALGAGRARVIRQTLTESLLLSALGGAAGLLLAYWGLDAVAALAPADTHGFRELRIDPLVLGFTVLAALAAGVLFGIAPSLNAGRGGLSGRLGHGGRTVGGGSNRLRGALVVSEIALSIVLLIGAGLLIRSLASLTAVDPGFRPDHLLKARITLPRAKYSRPEQLVAFGDTLLAAVRNLPGVRYATLANGVPMQELSIAVYGLEGVPARPGEPRTAAASRAREDYFETLGIRLIRGRLFTRRDVEGAKPTPIIVNETFARQNWPNQDPIGKVVLQDGERGSVVGVVADMRQLGPDTPIRPQLFFPSARLQAPMLLVRTAGDPMALAPAVEKLVWNIDREQPVWSVGTMDTVLHDWTSGRRFNMFVLLAFAALALVLAAVGLYGVLAYSVSLRTREIGIRVALGAEPGTIARLVVGRGFLLTLAGVGTGLAAAFALTRLMASLLYGVSATDPLTFAGVALSLVLVSLAASYLPARRAARVAPMEALRVE
ncbi:MAG TPA: ABC transporter permease [Bryobacteraceae bacterium]|nr:ABC transporter permease [Bryobacteraceae bacterium]